jgi:NAD+ diphosphatase
MGLRALFDRTSPEMYGAAARAVPIAEWRRTTRHCGVCATAMERDPAERAMVCPACKHRVYPRINPVVIVRVTRGDEVLLARRAAGPTGFFSVVAGFVEAGEALEETLAREVREEVGITVRNVRYFHSQAWSFPNNLMIAFTAEYADGMVRPDGVEMAEAGWFRRNALPTLPGPISIARRMIDAWLAERPPRPRE